MPAKKTSPSRWTGPPFTDPVTIVHEVLHLFGASDKYGVPLRSFAPKSVTHREVMRLDEESLIRLRIDPLTAREIGWLRRPRMTPVVTPASPSVLGAIGQSTG